MSEINGDVFSKYHRKTPIKEFYLNQTLYSLVTNENKDNQKLQAVGFLGSTKTYGQLFNEVNRLCRCLCKIRS